MPVLKKYLYIIVSLIVAVGVLVLMLLGYARSNQALRQSAKTADCVNTVLGERQAINDTPALLEQANANAAWAQAIVAAVGVPKDATPAARAAATRTFVAAVGDYARISADVQRTLAAHQRQRLNHPLGEC